SSIPAKKLMPPWIICLTTWILKSKVTHMTEEEIKQKLTPEQYEIMRKKGTEAPFTGKYYNSHEKGMYVCAVCGQELFSSDTKFDSGTGWPSFTDPVN